MLFLTRWFGVTGSDAERNLDKEKSEIEEITARSEEHTSELQSRSDLVCRLLLEKKKKNCDRLPRGWKNREATTGNENGEAPKVYRSPSAFRDDEHADSHETNALAAPTTTQR